MEGITGVFRSQEEAERTVVQLQQIGIAKKRLGLLVPGSNPHQIERAVPTVDTEEPGMGKAMGAAVGGAMGAAGGATVGLAAATLAIPGVGPVLAFGLLGAALLGVGGAVAGAKVGETLEEELGEGLPREDVYLYEDALRRGHTVVIAYAEEGSQASKAREIFDRNGAEDEETLRENWWQPIRDRERESYATIGKNFDTDEMSYRRGFHAAQHPDRRGKLYADVEPHLRELYADDELDTAFQHGYERGRSFYVSSMGIRRD
ncbi:MAG TPA: hypothetical protein VFH91_00575 [Pyrinomonadaceae bacterium]|nr:hypothetical protein [Pyrinomonadaceae bacterium]